MLYNMNIRNKSSEIPEKKESNIGRNFAQRYARFFIDWHFLKGHRQLTRYFAYNPKFSYEWTGDRDMGRSGNFIRTSHQSSSSS